MRDTRFNKTIEPEDDDKFLVIELYIIGAVTIIGCGMMVLISLKLL